MPPTKMETSNEMLTNLSIGMKKRCQKETWRKQYKEQKRLPSTQDVNKYLKSDTRLNLIATLKATNVSSEMKMSSKMHTLVRGLIFIQIFIYR